jgi:hypothetical protein
VPFSFFVSHQKTVLSSKKVCVSKNPWISAGNFFLYTGAKSDLPNETEKNIAKL